MFYFPYVLSLTIDQEATVDQESDYNYLIQHLSRIGYLQAGALIRKGLC